MHIFRAIRIQIILFESVTEPIGLYGSEVLSYKNLHLFEQINKYKLICKRKHENWSNPLFLEGTLQRVYIILEGEN